MDCCDSVVVCVVSDFGIVTIDRLAGGVLDGVHKFKSKLCTWLAGSIKLKLGWLVWRRGASRDATFRVDTSLTI